MGVFLDPVKASFFYLAGQVIYILFSYLCTIRSPIIELSCHYQHELNPYNYMWR